MPAMMDVIFSMILGMTIILIIFNANMIVGEGWMEFNHNVMVQQMLISTAAILEGEFRNIGFGINKSTINTGAILEAGPDFIKFQTLLRDDPDGTGDLDEVEYFLGEPGEMNYQNENIRVLYRRVNDKQAYGVGLVTHFQLRYVTLDGDTITTITEPGHVHLIEIEMEVQSPYGIYRDPKTVKEGESDVVYATSLWRQTRLGSKNFLTVTRNVDMSEIFD